MTKILVNNKQEQRIYKSYRECSEKLGIKYQYLMNSRDYNIPVKDKEGNTWYVDELYGDK